MSWLPGSLVEIDVGIRMPVAVEELLDPQRAHAVDRADHDHVADVLRDELDAAQDERPHHGLGEVAVGLDHRQQLPRDRPRTPRPPRRRGCERDRGGPTSRLASPVNCPGSNEVTSRSARAAPGITEGRTTSSRPLLTRKRCVTGCARLDQHLAGRDRPRGGRARRGVRTAPAAASERSAPAAPSASRTAAPSHGAASGWVMRSPPRGASHSSSAALNSFGPLERDQVAGVGDDRELRSRDVLGQEVGLGRRDHGVVGAGDRPASARGSDRARRRVGPLGHAEQRADHALGLRRLHEVAHLRRHRRVLVRSGEHLGRHRVDHAVDPFELHLLGGGAAAGGALGRVGAGLGADQHQPAQHLG